MIKYIVMLCFILLIMFQNAYPYDVDSLPDWAKVYLKPKVSNISELYINLDVSQQQNLEKKLNKIMSKASENGTTPIIVKLNSFFMPEGFLNNSEKISQRQKINKSQNDLIDNLKSITGKTYKYKKFNYSPLIAFEANVNDLQELMKLDGVEDIFEDKLSKPYLLESTALIGATNAWGLGASGSGQAVAILDTGVDKNHPMLTGKVVSEACYSTNYSYYSSTTICPGGVESSTATGSAMPYGGACPAGECDHGTHVAGIAAGNGSVYKGVAPGANIIAVQVFSKFDNVDLCNGSSPCALSYDSDQVLGLERIYAIRGSYNIASVNMSLGGGEYTSYCDSESQKPAIDNLRSANIATVIASGNESLTNAIGAPACISTAVSVGSTNDGSHDTTADVVSYYSNSANILNLLAPGMYITSAVPGTTYESWGGTSMAAPHVAGAWAVLKSARPSSTVTQVLTSLVNTGTNITDSRNGIIKPRINVDDALNAILSLDYYVWIGNTSVWSLSSNWSANAVPGSNSDVYIGSSPLGGNMPEVTSGTQYSNSVSIDGGLLTVKDSGKLIIN